MPSKSINTEFWRMLHFIHLPSKCGDPLLLWGLKEFRKRGTCLRSNEGNCRSLRSISLMLDAMLLVGGSWTSNRELKTIKNVINIFVDELFRLLWCCCQEPRSTPLCWSITYVLFQVFVQSFAQQVTQSGKQVSQHFLVSLYNYLHFLFKRKILVLLYLPTTR